MKKSLKMMLCLSAALLMLGSLCLTPVAALDTLQSDQIEFHSFEEWKQLCDAAEKSENAFASALSALDQDCDKATGGHLNFRLEEGTKPIKMTFDAYNAKMAELRVLVPNSLETVWVEKIVMSSYDAGVSSYSVNYLTEYEGKTYRLYTTTEKDCSAILGQESGDPFRTIEGKGYTIKVWKRGNADLNYQNYRAYYFLDGETVPSFYMTLASSNWQEEIPDAMLPLLREFRVTTAQEVLEELEPSRTWIWVSAAVVVVAGAVVGVWVVCKKKREE